MLAFGVSLLAQACAVGGGGAGYQGVGVGGSATLKVFTRDTYNFGPGSELKHYDVLDFGLAKEAQLTYLASVGSVVTWKAVASPDITVVPERGSLDAGSIGSLDI